MIIGSYIIGLIIITLNLLFLYFLRYNNEKILKKWMILVAILIECVPIMNGIIGLVTSIILLIALCLEKDLKLKINSKLKNWFNETI